MKNGNRIVSVKKTRYDMIEPSNNEQNNVQIIEESEERVFSGLHYEEMRHEEKMSHDAVVRTSAKTVRTISILLIVVLILGFGVWFLTHGIAQQNEISANVERLINQAKFDEARSEADKLLSRGDTLGNRINNIIENRRLRRDIKVAEETWNSKNYKPIGKKSSLFIKMDKDEAKKYLVDQGFNKKNIIMTEITYDSLSKKYKKYPADSVIEISIDGDKRFNEKKEFSPNSIIKIQYTGKK